MRALLLVPTGRAVGVALGVGALCAVAVFHRPLGWVVLSADGLLLGAILLDFLRAPALESLTLTRALGPVLSAGVPHPVTLVLERRRPGLLRGELRDEVPLGLSVDGHRQAFRLTPEAGLLKLTYRVTPERRGDFVFGKTHVRLRGPWQLAQRQGALGEAAHVKSFPDLQLLRQDPGLMAQASAGEARRLGRRAGEGREFESLREYRSGDDVRSVDWKASARRGSLTVRQHRPEQNQTLILCLDCGRHMAGTVQGRAKLDFAVDAALRVAAASLHQGDRVGLVLFGARVRDAVPPGKGKAQLKNLCQALYRATAALEESDYGAALDRALQQTRTRALIVVLTDLLDADTAAGLLQRTGRLRPRHLPLVISLLDEEVRRTARAIPSSADEALRRSAAVQLELEGRQTVAQLIQRGARVIRTGPTSLGPAAVREYLVIKARGQL